MVNSRQFQSYRIISSALHGNQEKIGGGGEKREMEKNVKSVKLADAGLTDPPLLSI